MSLYCTANYAADRKKVPILFSSIRVPTYVIPSDPLAPAKPGEKSLDILIALYNHFEPKQSIITEHFHFHKWDQTVDKTISNFDAALIMLASNCQFGDTLQEGLHDSFMDYITMPFVTVWAKTRHIRTQTEIHFIAPAYSYTN